MKHAAVGGMAAILLLCAAPAAARVVDYDRADAQFAEDAFKLEVSEVAKLPGRGSVDVVVDAAPRLDHRLKILSISCKLYKVDNPLSRMVERTLAAWDRDGSVTAQAGPGDAATLIRLRFDGAASTIRCVAQDEFTWRCLTRTSINAIATVEERGRGPRSEAIAVEVEQEQSIGGVCGGLARGAGLSGRAASVELVERLKKLTAAN